ncbi:thioredoxin family protein [Glaciimonas sp. PCH181]|uniref:DUF1223 domain-containing protein n=1 Tax=Glaciimonas sp. PCH181 TaxID=2133943 RepID=UPI001CED52D9|nr:DUF1223 domain-containing protein [Glaciimonas sp. PCH181]
MRIYNVISAVSKYVLLLVFSSGAMAVAQAAEITAKSPAHRVALVELYSSEGCNSCPPADAWLAKIGAKTNAELVVPLALHVDYWDGLGWKDRFGDHKFTLRQQALADFASSKVVYTPEVFAGGRELRHWNSASAADGAIQAITAQASPADITIKLSPKGARLFDLSASVKLRSDSRQPHSAYVAVYQNKLVSKVAAGENGGVTLHHEYVVRRWLGPFALKDGAVEVQEKIALDSIGIDVPADQIGIVTFVQNGVTGEVLQVARLALNH